jgi:hypothetical protein
MAICKTLTSLQTKGMQIYNETKCTFRGYAFGLMFIRS